MVPGSYRCIMYIWQVFLISEQTDDFLEATSHLYKRVCPSVCPCVRVSVSILKNAVYPVLGASNAGYPALLWGSPGFAPFLSFFLIWFFFVHMFAFVFRWRCLSFLMITRGERRGSSWLALKKMLRDVSWNLEGKSQTQVLEAYEMTLIRYISERQRG